MATGDLPPDDDFDPSSAISITELRALLWGAIVSGEAERLIRESGQAAATAYAQARKRFPLEAVGALISIDEMDNIATKLRGAQEASIPSSGSSTVSEDAGDGRDPILVEPPEQTFGAISKLQPE